MTSVMRLIFCGWVFPYISCIPYSLYGWGLLRFEVPEMFGERRNDTLMWIETFDWATEKKLLLSILPGQIITSGRSKDSRSKWFNRRTKTIRTWTPSPQSKETRWMSEGHRWSRSSRHGTAGSSRWFRNKTVVCVLLAMFKSHDFEWEDGAHHVPIRCMVPTSLMKAQGEHPEEIWSEPGVSELSYEKNFWDNWSFASIFR